MNPTTPGEAVAAYSLPTIELIAVLTAAIVLAFAARRLRRWLSSRAEARRARRQERLEAVGVDAVRPISDAEMSRVITDDIDRNPREVERLHKARRNAREGRRISRADVRAQEADLDKWEAEMLGNLDAEWQRRWAPEPVAEWPPEVTPLQTHRTLADFPPQPMPARELVPYVPDPSWAHIAPMYNGDAGEWRSERLDGAPVVDEQTYASEVLVGLSRSDSRITNHAALAMSQAFGHVVEAMPVSPAPNGRPTSHRRGVAEGTQTQRLKPDFVSWEQADWEQPTGAFPVLEMAGAS